jgi:intracellular multiplication protein IcmW
MPDLHLDAVHAFWDSYDRRTLYRVIVAIEHVEHWAMDNIPEIEAALIRLGEVMDQNTHFELSEEAKIIRVLINIHAGRALRLLQSLDMAKSGTASQILMFAEEASEAGEGKASHTHAQLFLRRNLVFERLQLLSRVFSPHRVSLVLKALEQYSEQNDSI